MRNLRVQMRNATAMAAIAGERMIAVAVDPARDSCSLLLLMLLILARMTIQTNKMTPP